MDDLVKRMRKGDLVSVLCVGEAADEIERLRGAEKKAFMAGYGEGCTTPEGHRDDEGCWKLYLKLCHSVLAHEQA